MKKLLVAMMLALALPAFAGKNDDIGPVATLNFVVLKDYSGKPVRNAAVVLHQVSDKGKQERGGLELKTDVDGKASYEGVPYGKLRIQVLATGLQTYGGDYDINQPTMEITIKLKRPEGQYSIYENHPDEQKPADPNAKPQEPK
ncbi:MAG: carboxypeptidase-like regulatory domain-containing protein [Terriglobales bacterium]